MRHFLPDWRRAWRAGVTVALTLAALWICSAPFSPRFRADLIFGRGFWYMRQGELRQAEADFTAALALDSTHAPAYLNRARVYVAQTRYAEAIADDTAVLLMYPDAIEALKDRALVYRMLGDFERAAADLSQVITLRPYDALAYFERAQAYDEAGQTAAARRDYRRFLDLYHLTDFNTEYALYRLDELSASE